MANLDLYKGGFESLNKLNETLTPTASKNKVSSQSLIMLLALNCGVDLSFFAKEAFINELLNMGFVEKKENSFLVTGKGAILAKSLERIM